MGCPISDGRLLNLAYDTNEHHHRMLGRATAESLCQVTIILRYYPEHAEAMEPLKEWVRDFQITP